MKAPSNTRRPVNFAAIDQRARRLRAATISDLMSRALAWVASAVASAVARSIQRVAAKTLFSRR
jgi:hypothetical protein